MFEDLEREHPHLKENIVSAMGNVDTSRLLDTRYLDSEGAETEEPFQILSEG
jgi:tRNA 2-thiocytidine biosynthesis protein TtcA